LFNKPVSVFGVDFQFCYLTRTFFKAVIEVDLLFSSRFRNRQIKKAANFKRDFLKFGKGIYFADMSSKSANYCFANKNNPFGILLLCEVALGEMHELTEAEYITKLPRGKHSTKGVGKTHPDPSEYFVDDNGVITPMGKSVSSGVKNSSLLYNEFIVYNKAQVNMKYLFKIEFEYEW
jgi:hypothetical protein